MQKRSIISLREEIKWLLQDEICTALLDVELVTIDTLNFVMKHVMEATPLRSSCVLDIIDLNFVYASMQSHEKFVQEFSKLKLPCIDYILHKESDLYYLVKNNLRSVEDENVNCIQNINMLEDKRNGFANNGTDSSTDELFNSQEVSGKKDEYKQEVNSQQSDISSVNGSEGGTDGGSVFT